MEDPDNITSNELGTSDTTVNYLRDILVVNWESYESEDDSEFDELSPIPETPHDHLDGDSPGNHHDAHAHTPTTPGSVTDNTCKPFKSIFQKPIKFEDIRENCWIPNESIIVKIICHDREGTTKVLNPYLYTILVKHGEFDWIVRRRYKHFRQLHDALVLFRTRYRIPFPQKRYQQRRKTLQRERLEQKQEGSPRNRSARFPLRPEGLISEQTIQQRQNQLECYLQSIVKIKSYRNHSETLRFFEVCNLSFVSRLGRKGKEGLINKCSGGRRINIGCCGCLKKAHIGGTWNRRWLVVKDTFVAYIRPEDGIVSDVMLMDSDFQVDVGILSAGVTHGVLISNLNRKLLIKCWTSRKAREWAECMMERSRSSAKDFTQENRFNSYAPVRENTYARWFVDGSSYFEAVADALEHAKEEIYITDWWLSPEIYMKRPMTEGDKWRLDLLLQRKADSGVKIFILLYKEIEMALGINSIYSKQTLVSKHPENIRVLRHPDHGANGVLLWAHHEKVVVVDQKIAFLGGFDLCYGRWDNEHHRITDLGSIALKTSADPSAATPRITIQHAESTDITELNDDLHSSADVLHSPIQNHTDPYPSDTIPMTPTTPTPTPLTPTPDANDPDKAHTITLSQSQVIVHCVNSDSPSETVTPSVVLPTESPIIITPATPLTPTAPNDADKPHSITLDQSQVIVHSAKTYSPSETVTPSVVHSANPDSPSERVTPSVSLSTESPVCVNSSVITENTESFYENEETSVDLVDHVRANLESQILNSIHNIEEVNGKHLWKDAAVKKNLKLKIPNQDVPSDISQRTAHPRKLQKSNITFGNIAYIDDDADYTSNDVGNHVDATRGTDTSDIIIRERHQTVESSRHSNDSSHSEGSKSELITKPISNSKNDIPDFSNTVVKLMAIKKLTRFKESNNNNDHQVATTYNAANNAQARRRWKMVLNVKKFESIVREPQTPEKIAREFFGGTPVPRNKLDKWQWHRHKDTSMLDLRTLDYTRHRTKSEEDILMCGLQGSSKLWIGKDYVNFIYKDFVNLESPFADFIDRSKCPRMPWHDIGTVVYGKGARDVARHFIARWNFTKLEKCKKNRNYPLLLPKNHVRCTVPPAIKNITFNVKTQILRSSCGWSAGIGSTESSIHEAYIHCIENAKLYIYIENQFFITQIGSTSSVSNKVGEALFNRILYAHKNDELFRVYVMMPLLPAFEGEFGTATGTAIGAVTHWNYSSICRGGNSLIERLAVEVPDPMKYVIFCGLRKHTELAGKPITELIYVHSKLMIVDDDTVIIGSANINDRSMLGKRDSEIAIMVEDQPENKFPVRVCNEVRMAGKFATSLRRTIFREHLGLKDSDVNIADIVSDHFYKDVWIKQAATNTTMFDKVFHCIPSDCVHTYSDLKQYQAEKTLADIDIPLAREYLSKIMGHIVLLPLHFLKDEYLAPTFGAKEAMLPTYLWT